MCAQIIKPCTLTDYCTAGTVETVQVFFSTYYSYSENNFTNLKRIQKHPFSHEYRGSEGCQENFKSMGSGAMMKPDSLDTDVYSLCKKELPLLPHLGKFT